MTHAEANVTPPTFTLEFALTVTVRGTKLEDLDNGLVAAAGERLRARMLNPPPGPLGMPKFATPTPPPPAATPAPTVAREEPPHVQGNVGGNSGPYDSKPAAPAEVVHPGGEAGQPADQPGTGKSKRGVKAGSTRGPYKKTAEEQAAENVAAQAAADNSAEIFKEPAQTAPIAPTGTNQPTPAVAPQGKIPDLQDAVKALTLVNTKQNSDVAWSCLQQFGVKRCGELTDANRGQFIAHCEKVAAGA